MVDSIDDARVAVTDATACNCETGTSMVISSAIFGVGGQCVTRLDPVGDVFGPRPHQHLADLVHQRDDVLVQVDQFVQAEAEAADLVECIDQLRPCDGGLGAVDADHLQPDQSIERLGVVDESLRLGQRPRGVLPHELMSL